MDFRKKLFMVVLIRKGPKELLNEAHWSAFMTHLLQTDYEQVQMRIKVFIFLEKFFTIPLLTLPELLFSPI